MLSDFPTEPRVVAACTLFICLAVAGYADQFGDFTYVEYDTYIEITDYPDDATGDVSIPSEIVGKPVTSIGERAFRLCRNLTSVYFYDMGMLTWWWTNSDIYPWIYAFDPPADNVGTDIRSEWCCTVQIPMYRADFLFRPVTWLGQPCISILDPFWATLGERFRTMPGPNKPLEATRTSRASEL